MLIHVLIFFLKSVSWKNKMQGTTIVSWLTEIWWTKGKNLTRYYAVHNWEKTWIVSLWHMSHIHSCLPLGVKDACVIVCGLVPIIINNCGHILKGPSNVLYYVKKKRTVHLLTHFLDLNIDPFRFNLVKESFKFVWDIIHVEVRLQLADLMINMFRFCKWRDCFFHDKIVKDLLCF